ncbi:hypothetical protein [Actinomadura sp. WMMA1423]|uniref:hypothetical protein n=1 Tax=Actinomadura sp. WMMA1423 TaxID=2591108 RepID=UPI001146D6BA|nr:hypothetical protein [Actinomadura sp. WMMA1423]
MGRRRYRRLLVGADTYRWSVGHRHERDEQGLSGCREVVLLRKEGRPGGIHVVFRGGPGRIVLDGGPYTHTGSVWRAEDESALNLNRPRVVRALIDVMVLERGEDFGSRVEVDGWTVMDAVHARLRPAER